MTEGTLLIKLSFVHLKYFSSSKNVNYIIWIIRFDILVPQPIWYNFVFSFIKTSLWYNLEFLFILNVHWREERLMKRRRRGYISNVNVFSPKMRNWFYFRPNGYSILKNPPIVLDGWYNPPSSSLHSFWISPLSSPYQWNINFKIIFPYFPCWYLMVWKGQDTQKLYLSR